MSQAKRKCRICLKWRVRGKSILVGKIGLPGAYEFECERCQKELLEVNL